MRICKTFTFLSIFIVLFYNCSLPADDEDEGNPEEDNTTSELPWEGETDKFTINSKEGLRLNDPQENAGTAYVTIPSNSVKNTRWEFGVRLTFNPSANNYARFYLTSSSNVLSGNVNGYYIQIGGAKDNVALYRQNGEQPKLLASGREVMKGNNSPKLYIKVECDNNGYWTFWTRLESENEYTKEKQVKDNSILTSLYCGIYCIYTKTRCKGFTFHHIQLSNDVETTTKPTETPDEPDKPDVPEDPVLPDYPEFQLVYQSDNLLSIGATRKNVQGYDIPIFDMERSVCDAIKYRNKVGIDVMAEILQTYLRRPDKNISRLMDYASKLRIRKTLNQYLEVWQ